MEWRDEGIVIGVRRHGESSAIVEAMTRAHGRHLGLVRGGRSTPPATLRCSRATASASSGARGSTSIWASTRSNRWRCGPGA